MPDVAQLVRALTSVYDDASRELGRIMSSADATDFQRGRASRLVRQVEAIVGQLKRANAEWASSSIAQAYQDAAEAIGRGDFSFEAVDTRAVEAIAARLVADLDRAVDAVPRDLSALFARTRQEAVPEGALLQQVGRARVLGLAPDDLQRRIAQTLRDGATQRLRGQLPADVLRRLQTIAEGRFIPIVGRDGIERRYSMRFYSETVARTWSMAAANEAALAMAEQFGTDLVQFPVHSGACPICIPWQGKIFSRTGQHPDFPPLSTIGTPPLHPNCRHRLLPVIEASLRRRGQYDELARFSGSKDEVDSLAAYRGMLERGGARAAADAAQRQVTGYAQKLGYKGPITYKDVEGDEVTVTGRPFRSAGHFNPRTGEVVVFKNAVGNDAALQGLVAHEVQHARFETFLATSVRQRAEAERLTTAIRGERWRTPDPEGRAPMDAGGFLRAQARSKYPALWAREKLLERVTEVLQREDGVSVYSREWWRAWEEQRQLPQGVFSPINETLAELSRLRLTNPEEFARLDTLKPSFFRLLRAVDRFGVEP
jgi:hypothetical protein